MNLRTTVNRHASHVNRISTGLVLLSLAVLIRAVPADLLFAGMHHGTAGAGIWGVVIFALVYILSVLLLAPGFVLTLAAGAVFGLVAGTLLIWVASMIAAALAFLIARYLARAQIERKARQRTQFDTVDRAVRLGGWKVVALLRVYPLVPYSVINYLFGLTALRFGPYILVTGLAMLPNVFLYVYLGYVGRAGLAGTGPGWRPQQPWHWAVLLIGLAGTVFTAGYIAWLARKAIRQRTTIGSDAVDDPGTCCDAEESSPAHADVAAHDWPWRTMITAVFALFVTIAAVWCHLRQDAIRECLTPQKTTLYYDP